MGRLTETILDAIYPPNVSCAICGSEAHTDIHGLCAECAALIQPAGIIGGSGFIDDIYYAVHYTEHIAAAVHNYKYNDARYLCRFFASLIELPKDWQIDAVLPMPLHPNKLKKRGYNQSALIARELCKKYGLMLDESLAVRIKDTKSQRELDRSQRAENMKNAFSASGSVKNKRILIIDDVFTTGATMNECAKALKVKGAAYIYAASACMAGGDSAQ